MPLRSPSGFAVFPEIDITRHLVDVHGARELIRQYLPLNLLRAAEMYLVRGHASGKIAGDKFAFMSAYQVPAVLLNYQDVGGGSAAELHFELPLTCDGGRFSRWDLRRFDFRRLRQYCVKPLRDDLIIARHHHVWHHRNRTGHLIRTVSRSPGQDNAWFR